MKNKSSRLFWIIATVIVMIILAFSLVRCVNTANSVDTSEFNTVVSLSAANDFTKDSIEQNKKALPVLNKEIPRNYESIELSEVVFDNYVVTYKITVKFQNGQIGYMTFTTNYSRSTEVVKELETQLTTAGVSYSYTNPNAGSIWSSLLPLAGSAILLIVFFILMMQTQGGTKGAMNFAKTNARLQQNMKTRFSDVAGAEEEKEKLYIL